MSQATEKTYAALWLHVVLAWGGAIVIGAQVAFLTPLALLSDEPIGTADFIFGVSLAAAGMTVFVVCVRLIRAFRARVAVDDAGITVKYPKGRSTSLAWDEVRYLRERLVRMCLELSDENRRTNIRLSYGLGELPELRSIILERVRLADPYDPPGSGLVRSRQKGRAVIQCPWRGNVYLWFAALIYGLMGLGAMADSEGGLFLIPALCMLGSLILLLIGLPRRITATPDQIALHYVLRTRRIPLARIQDVVLDYASKNSPTIGRVILLRDDGKRIILTHFGVGAIGLYNIIRDARRASPEEPLEHALAEPAEDAAAAAGGIARRAGGPAIAYARPEHLRLSRSQRIQIAAAIILPLLAVLGVWIAAAFGPVTSQSWSYQSCERCGAMRVVHITTRMRTFHSVESKLIYTTDRSPRSGHEWEEGIPGDAGVKPGRVLLLRREGAFGAVIFEETREESRSVSYRYVYRSDGGGGLDPRNPAVTRGEGRGNPVEFGPFHFRVYPVADKSGVIQRYSVPYQQGWLRDAQAPVDEIEMGPLREVDEHDLALYGTERTSFDGLDASDPRWIYRASAIDTRFEP